LDYRQFIILRFISNCFCNFSFRQIIHGDGVSSHSFGQPCRNPLLGFCCLSGKPFALLRSRKLLPSLTRVSQLRCSLFRKIRCLGFAPRSESFAIEPLVQVCSISSLSGLTSCRPSANPLNSITELSPDPHII